MKGSHFPIMKIDNVETVSGVKLKNKNVDNTQYRATCHICRKAQVMCYCSSIQPFISNPQFVILIHPKEVHKAINTGRMAYRLIKNAFLFEGVDFTDHAMLNEILADESKSCFLLFPGQAATDLKDLKYDNNGLNKRQIVFIILDATWHMARKMFALSFNLQKIPQVMFYPDTPSKFLIRKQPHSDFYSTIETIHHIILVMGNHPDGEYEQLMQIFQTMVQTQANWKAVKQSEWNMKTRTV